MRRPFWRSRCPHSHLSGIYGDAINTLNTRLICMRCNRSIDGPVALAAIRRRELIDLAPEGENPND